VVSQTLRKVVPDATLRATGTGGAILLQLSRQSREAFVKSNAAGNDGIVAPSDEADQPLIRGLLCVPSCIPSFCPSAGVGMKESPTAPGFPKRIGQATISQ